MTDRPNILRIRNTSIGDNKLYREPPIYATMFRGERHRLNLYHGDSGLDGELYDRVDDPLEQTNLWADGGSAEVRWPEGVA